MPLFVGKNIFSPQFKIVPTEYFSFSLVDLPKVSYYGIMAGYRCKEFAV
jgi:hypothetical protein